MEKINIKKENIACYGLAAWEQTGTLSIDFPNNLDNLQKVVGMDLAKLSSKGWYQVGFKFGKSLIENSDTLHLNIIMSRRVENEIFEFGYVTRKINKKEFLDLIVNFVAQVANIVHFKNDDISWKELDRIEE